MILHLNLSSVIRDLQCAGVRSTVALLPGSVDLENLEAESASRTAALTPQSRAGLVAFRRAFPFAGKRRGRLGTARISNRHYTSAERVRRCSYNSGCSEFYRVDRKQLNNRTTGIPGPIVDGKSFTGRSALFTRHYTVVFIGNSYIQVFNRVYCFLRRVATPPSP